MQLPFQHHVDFVIVQGPREECVLPLHKTGGHAAAVVSGHKISQAHAMRLCAVETTKLDAAAINHFDAAFAGHRFEARLHCALLQRLFFLHHFFHQLCDQAFGKLAFRQLGNDGFADALAFGFVGWHAGGHGRRYRDRFITFGDGKTQ